MISASIRALPRILGSSELDNHGAVKDVLIIALRSLTISDKQYHLLSQYTSD